MLSISQHSRSTTWPSDRKLVRMELWKAELGQTQTPIIVHCNHQSPQYLMLVRKLVRKEAGLRTKRATLGRTPGTHKHYQMIEATSDTMICRSEGGRPCSAWRSIERRECQGGQLLRRTQHSSQASTHHHVQGPEPR